MSAEFNVRVMSKRSGSVKAATILGVPVFVHWSFCIGGLLLSAVTGFNLVESLYYSIAYVFLIAIHEAGHFFAARSLGLAVFSIEISGLGGQCKIQPPRAIRDTLFVVSAGLLAQCALLLATVLFIAAFGPPHTPFWKCMANTFTIYNGVLFLMNIIPR